MQRADSQPSGAQEGRVLCIKLLHEGNEGPAQQLWADWSYSAASVMGELRPASKR